ncbi:hypothetical protein VNO80_23397 [Phaseolus coccineus]|uniref:Uncharacterized protein n=1 Tax=Phaseolus coccineus TaxID=3886 RepID=A0AAN9M5Q0_PHACN
MLSPLLPFDSPPPCKCYLRFLWIQFRYRYENGRRHLGIPETEVFASIMDFYSSGQLLFLDSQAAVAMDMIIHQFALLRVRI